MASRSGGGRELAPRTFRNVGLSEELARAVEERFGYREPTAVQALVIPRLLKGESMAFSSSTGTGKTLAYVLPTVAQLRADEAAGVVVRPQRPRAVVLVPSRELALQVADVVRRVCRSAPLRTAVLHGGTRKAPQHEKLEGPLDVVVATPGRLAELREARKLFVTDVRHVVLDEADTLFDASFRAEVNALVAPLADMARAKEARRVQFVAVGATLSADVTAQLQAALPHLAVVRAPLVTTESLQQSFVHVQQGEKHRRLIAEVRALPADGKCIVFCNTVPSARSTQHVLREAGIQAASIHGMVPARRRTSEWESFASGAVKVLVCTDLAARGLDDEGVSHVVLFDFPHSVLDYIHRVGRTARAQRPGAALSFVTKRDRSLALDIERAVQQRSDLWQLVPKVPQHAPTRTKTPLGKWKRVVPPRVAAKAGKDKVIVAPAAPETRGRPRRDRPRL